MKGPTTSLSQIAPKVPGFLSSCHEGSIPLSSGSCRFSQNSSWSLHFSHHLRLLSPQASAIVACPLVHVFWYILDILCLAAAVPTFNGSYSSGSLLETLVG